MNPRVTKVVVLDGHILGLTFTNGETGLYDCTPLLGFGIFRELEDVRYFCKASVAYGTVVWPNGQDIGPDTLYLDSKRHPAGGRANRPATSIHGEGLAAVGEDAPVYGHCASPKECPVRMKRAGTKEMKRP